MLKKSHDLLVSQKVVSALEEIPLSVTLMIIMKVMMMMMPKFK